MANPEYPNSGILFNNDRATHAKAPQMKGNGTVQCPECGRHFDLDLAGWEREGKRGPFLSLQIKATNKDGR